MTANQTIIEYVVLKATDALPEDGTRIEVIQNYLVRALYKDTTPPDPLPFKVMLSNPWKIALEDGDPLMIERPTGSLFLSRSLLRGTSFSKAVDDDKGQSIFLGIGISMPVRTADHWCPRDAPVPIFGNRDDARGLMRADYLATQGALGENVNVIVVDRGVDKDYIRALSRTIRRRMDATGTSATRHDRGRPRLDDCAEHPGHCPKSYNLRLSAAGGFGFTHFGYPKFAR